MTAPGPLDEFGLIERFFAPLAGPSGLGLKDDAALVHVPAGHDLVTTVDAIIEGVHFLPSDPAETIGWKALGVNVSDLAAKGAEPLGFLLTLALPKHIDASWLAGFADGLGRAADLWSCPLVGGDTVKMPGPLTLSITAFGAVPSGTMLRRSGARPGDILAVTGTMGDAALGLPLARGSMPSWASTLKAEDRAFLVERYRRPRPRINVAAMLRADASAAMDISDGLLGDAAKMLAVSGCGALIDANLVPLSDAARHALTAEPSCLETVLTGGDDYEILCAVPPAHWDRLQANIAACGVPFTRIGMVTEREAGFSVQGSDGPLNFSSLAFNHFGQDNS